MTQNTDMRRRQSRYGLRETQGQGEEAQQVQNGPGITEMKKNRISNYVK